MTWRKEFGIDHMKHKDYVLIAIIAFSLIGIVSQRPIAFIVVGVFATYFILNKMYDKRIGENVKLANPRTAIRLFPGEEAGLTFELQNRSIFPMVNGEFQFQLNPAVRVLEDFVTTGKTENQNKLPLSITGRKKTTIKLSILAEHRGAARISSIKYRFPHLFNFDSVTLTYSPYFHTEFIVFPKLIPVEGIESVFQMISGPKQINFSPFEDVGRPLGTRDYSYGDPFHRINWKASAKTQGLQTNVYEKVVDMSYIFIVNLEVGQEQYSKNFEALLSYAAYVSQYATEKGFPFELFINARRPGKVPFVHLPVGEGKTQYVHALEMLARIKNLPMTVPFNQMLHRIGQHFFKPSTVIMIGEIPAGASEIINKWMKQQKTIFHIVKTEDSAVIKPWVGEAGYYTN